MNLQTRAPRRWDRPSALASTSTRGPGSRCEPATGYALRSSVLITLPLRLFSPGADVSKLMYHMRINRDLLDHDLLAAFDWQMRASASASLSGDLPDHSWWQATTGVTCGGLGFRTALGVALPAFVTSRIMCRPLVSTMIRRFRPMQGSSWWDLPSPSLRHARGIPTMAMEAVDISWHANASSPLPWTRASIRGCFRRMRTRAPWRLTRGCWNLATQRLITHGCGASTRVMDPCWSLRSTLTRYAGAWAAPDPVNWCLDPATQAPLTQPVVPSAATTRLLHLCSLRLSPATALPRLRFPASSLALTPTSSPRPSATLTLPSTFRSALRTQSRPGLTAHKPSVKPNWLTLGHISFSSLPEHVLHPDRRERLRVTSLRHVDRVALSQQIHRAQTQLFLR